MNWRFRRNQWIGDDGEYRVVLRLIQPNPNSTTQFFPFYVLQYSRYGRMETVSLPDVPIETIKANIYQYLMEELL